MARALLTDSLARKLTAACGSKITYDAGPNRIPGLGLRVSATSKSWVLGYSVGGRERRIVIGSYPAWDVKKARARAAELRRLVDQGRDPLAKRAAVRRAPQEALDELADDNSLVRQ